MPQRSRRILRIGASLVTAVAVLATTSATASAGVLVASAPSCAAQGLSKTFWAWLDPADYTELPGGDFESGTSAWELTGGAKVVRGNEIFKVDSGRDRKSLELPPGSSATSDTICVGIAHPTIRFFTKRNDGGVLSLSTVKVEVLFEAADGSVKSLTMGVVSNGGSWQPTLPLPIIANLLPLLPGEMTPVRFRFTALGSANWSVDDIWVDPYARR